MKKRGWMLLLTLLLLLPLTVKAEAMEVWQLLDEKGALLTTVCYPPEVGDQYLSADNALYEIVSVAEDTATARFLENVELPDVSWLDAEAALPVSATDRRIALYCTHSDESYQPTDGVYSKTDRGSIYDVAAALGNALEEGGVTVEVSRALHHPHDAGAYRRSRQTAVQLMKGAPNAMFDIHRDGIPDPDEYAVTIGSKKTSKVRILVGRGNQNMSVNKDFALQVKAVADKTYPKLIKDIYMGKGTYNQDLMPKALLLECGTYTLSKERVLTAMPMMANVLHKSLYGGVVGSAGASDTKGRSEDAGGVTEGQPDPTPAEDTSGVGTGIWWIVGIFVAGLIVYAVAATGSAKGAWHKLGRNVNEMTGGLVGKKPDDHESTGQQ